jgi:hypothetical protein
MRCKLCLCAAALAVCALVSPAQANLILTGVIDGDLPGGLPKAVVITATADIADLSIYGAGSANNGGGTDGEETTFAGSATAGDVIIVVDGATSQAFFEDNFVDTFLFFSGGSSGGAAAINGDDAVELFQSGAVIDTYGDPGVIGDGETWDYTDGYAVRTGGVAGAFSQANYTSVFQGLDGLDETAQAQAIASAFGFTPVPEPTALVLVALGLLGAAGTRRK